MAGIGTRTKFFSYVPS